MPRHLKNVIWITCQLKKGTLIFSRESGFGRCDCGLMNKLVEKCGANGKHCSVHISAVQLPVAMHGWPHRDQKMMPSDKVFSEGYVFALAKCSWDVRDIFLFSGEAQRREHSEKIAGKLRHHHEQSFGNTLVVMWREPVLRRLWRKMNRMKN